MARDPKGGRFSNELLLSGAAFVFALVLGATAAATESIGDLTPCGVASAELEIMLPGALPPSNLRSSDLDAVRGINHRASLGRAMYEAGLRRKREDAGEFTPEARYRSPSNPDEARVRIQEEYGPDSILTRSADTVAALADGAEKSAAKPFAGMATVTESIVNRSGEALGFDPIDVPRIKPRISGKRAGVYVSTRW